MTPLVKGDKIIVNPWNPDHEAKPATVVSVEKTGRQVEVDYGKGRYQWVAVKRCERA